MADKQEKEKQNKEQPTLDQQMVQRQSAPRPTAREEAEKLYMQQNQAPADGALDGFKVLREVIGREEVQQAQLTLNKYKEGKANLEKRIVENEQWYKLRHWECLRKSIRQRFW